MRFSLTSLAVVALTSAAVLFGCVSGSNSSDDDEGDDPESGGSGPSNGGVGAGSGAPAGGASSGKGNGGSSANTGGVGGGGGTDTGGSSTGGSNGGSATGGEGGTSGVSTGGVSGASGANPGGASGASTGGVSGGSGGGAGGAPMDVDKNGKRNAAPGTMTSTPQDYLRMGEIRLLNNNWGSEDLNCSAPTSTMSVFINANRSFGWTFNRGNCDTGNTNQHPDFPQVEFGMHPFGVGNALATSPDFSSTTLLPRRIRDITSASVAIQGLSIQLQQGGSWNITFEFWLSSQDPNTAGNAGVHTELMTFWGWQSGRWPTAPGADGSGGATGATVTSSSKTYTLWVQDDTWADGWRYYQFRDNAGPGMSFNGTVNVKALLDYLVNTRSFSPDLWVTRLEVGSEIDDLTQGTVTMQNITFEVNGQSRSPVFGP